MSYDLPGRFRRRHVNKHRTMRIMHVVSNLSTYGAENFVAQLAAELSDRAVPVSVLTVYDTPAASRSAVFTGPIFSAQRRNSRDFGFFFRMVKLIKTWKPTIVHTHVHNGKYWGRLAAIAAGVPHIVHTEHNSDFRAGTLERCANRIFHRATDRVIAFSRSHASALASAERLSESKIAVIPNGIRHARSADRQRPRAALALNEAERAVFVVGRLEAVKNQELAILSLRHLPPELRARTRLFIIGNGIDESKLRTLVAQQHLEEQVTFLGFRPDVRELLPAADALLVVSLNEAMPLSVIEAMTAAVPVVSTPWNGVHEILGDAPAWISDGWEPAEVAAALKDALRDSSGLRDRLHDARELARRHYDIGVTTRRHIGLYEALV